MEEIDTVRVLLVHITTLVGLPGFLGNILLLLAIFKSKMLGENPSYVIIASLALVDLCSLIGRPFLVTYGLMSDTYNGDVFTGFGTIWMWFATQAHFFLIAFNRFACVQFRDSYQRWFGQIRILAAAGACWLFGAVLAVPTLAGAVVYGFQRQKYTFLYDTTHESSVAFSKFSLSISVMNLIAIIIVYTYIYLRVRRQQAASRTVNVELDATAATSGVGEDGEVSTTKQFLAVTVFFILMNISFFATLGLAASGHVAAAATAVVTNLLVAVSSAVKPIVYAVGDAELRENMKSAIPGCSPT